MSECRCWNCLTHHNGDYGACENCSTVGRDRPSMCGGRDPIMCRQQTLTESELCLMMSWQNTFAD